jgi:GT2 family glycosyltransferase
MLDDGTPDRSYVDKLSELSQEWNIPLIINSENKGIPYSWNRLTEYYDAEYVILLNDDIQVCSADWLNAFLYFMENNKEVGSIGFPIIHIDAMTGQPDKQYTKPDVNGVPGRVGSPVGCCFGFRKDLWAQVKQPDGSTGFYESIRSFYEEIDFGFELSKMGYSNYMIPCPILEHWGSQTFAKNPELSYCEFNDNFSKEKYIDIMKKSPTTLPIPIEKHIELAEKYGAAYRMDYARCIFAKKWECEDYWNVPQVHCQETIIDKIPHRMVKWLGPTGEREHEV